MWFIQIVMASTMVGQLEFTQSYYVPGEYETEAACMEALAEMKTYSPDIKASCWRRLSPR